MGLANASSRDGSTTSLTGVAVPLSLREAGLALCLASLVKLALLGVFPPLVGCRRSNSTGPFVMEGETGFDEFSMEEDFSSRDCSCSGREGSVAVEVDRISTSISSLAVTERSSCSWKLA